ncbi:hypothetical protein BY996DRAFT_6498557 [Phakopsora pachyrhizi]|uniref:Uncharacterized protein n=1 Tax=Phakopsora pachyrhizi TaxID=170000 RepID=A0AAV0BUS7_PHAPC|nr:hypothetical protein BY996DRAFT_6498557 [Phakopsora pachyrhizi]CAH7690405.1 hypothetical protein PPACK8108_LOCUS25748 [Phakopsora pachyrhizi]
MQSVVEAAGVEGVLGIGDMLSYEKNEERDGSGLGDDCDCKSHRDKYKVLEGTEDAEDFKWEGVAQDRRVRVPEDVLSNRDSQLNPVEGVGVIVDRKWRMEKKEFEDL